MQADAIARTLYRLWFSRRSLLAGTTAAQLSRPSDKPPMLFFYLSMVTGAAVAGLSLLPGGTWAGLAVGADSVVGPMYIAEIAPARQRGRLVSYQQFAITIGILAAYGIDYLLLSNEGDAPLEDRWESPTQYDEGSDNWEFVSPSRLMFGASYTLGSFAIFSLDYDCLLYTSPSPRDA